jgi:hypothetical protein
MNKKTVNNIVTVFELSEEERQKLLLELIEVLNCFIDVQRAYYNKGFSLAELEKRIPNLYNFTEALK